MTVDVVNAENKKVGVVELSDAVFGGRVKTDLIHASVVRSNAADRRGTHATKTRGLVSGSGRKPWRQKGTGRARVGETRTPLWRKGGTVFGPQPRSYAFTAPKKVELAGLQAALAQKAQDGDLVIVDALAATAMLKTIGVNGKALLVDVQLDENLALSLRNIPGVKFLQSSRINARDVMDTTKVVLTQSAVEKLQSALGA
jgi:large subunit ribosomal protein L4